jgi:DNA-directed RNA polymerase subunit H (RpoH/RPB5)
MSTTKSKVPVILSVWRQCFQVLMEMLTDRAWTNIQTSSNIETLHLQYCNAKSLVILLASASRPIPNNSLCRFCTNECKLSIFVCLAGNFTSPALQHIETLRHNVGHVLVLFQDKVTATLRDDFFKLQKYELELKHFFQLYVNVSKHRLVPAHRCLSAAEELEIVTRYRCTKDKFPAIFVTDPVVRYYNFPVGSLLEIRRPMLYYRHVVLAPAKTNYEKFFCD